MRAVGGRGAATTDDGRGTAAADRQRTPLRHRRVLRAALRDIAQGADALSEIDFGVLCRRQELPRPTRQALRVEPNGRRRYLDVEWITPDGRRVAAEIDGAIHLRVEQWVSDQPRQNEVVIGGTTVLRFPSVTVRTDEVRVADQLRRVLRCRS